MDRLMSKAYNQLRSAQNVVGKIFDALPNNQIEVDTALVLLSAVREQIANAYDQIIELRSFLQMDDNGLEGSKIQELNSLDAGINRVKNDSRKL